METICLHDRGAIESLLRRNVELNIYQLGDLDDFFWDYTTWYGLRDGSSVRAGVRAIVLLYSGMSLPTVIALAEEERPAVARLLRSLLSVLPARFYAHCTPGIEEALRERYALQPSGPHLKMALDDRSRLGETDVTEVVRLGAGDEPDLRQLYATAYPGNWFDERMLQTAQYFGVRREGALVSVVGIHVYSPRYRVAALGNIVTHPDHRGQGLARAATARLCSSLLETVDHVGLNVARDNAAAIRCYERLGFATIADYGEFMVELKSA